MNPPKNSPWGTIQSCDPMSVEGIYFVSTAGHGGIYVAPELRGRIPREAVESAFVYQSRGLEGWFEEDCDWCIPYLIFALNPEEGEKQLALNSLKAHHPHLVGKIG